MDLWYIGKNRGYVYGLNGTEYRREKSGCSVGIILVIPKFKGRVPMMRQQQWNWNFPLLAQVMKLNFIKF